MVKTKANRPERPRPEDRVRPTIEKSAAALDALGVDAASFLNAAVRAERMAQGKGPVEALREDPRMLFAPSVSFALVEAAWKYRAPTYSTPFVKTTADVEKETGFKYLPGPVDVEDCRAEGTLLRDAWRALYQRIPEIGAAETGASVVAGWLLAREHEKEADRLSERYSTDSARRAWEGLAAKKGRSVSALRQQVTRAKSLAVKSGIVLPWPKKRARRF